MIKVVPSILTGDPDELRTMMKLAEGVVDRVSIDIIDGKFAGNKTVEPDIIADIDTDLLIDYQLMVVEPVNWIERCVKGQADRIIGHIEHMRDQVEFVGRVQKVGAKVGLGIDLATPVSDLDPVILNNLDVVLVMSVPAGFGGQKFHPEVLEKINELDEIRARDDTPFVIHDDGGVTFEYVDDLRREMVDEVSIGNRLFKGDLKDNIGRYLKAAYE